ncbi:MAG: YtxH domain-containing protein [Actinomycetia bacterium]|nr:YtxH domain-containing protein [Actinomycetes bacterium]
MRGHRFTDFGIGVLTGAIGGIVMGFLLAPESGARTRRRLASEALRVADTARVVADRAERAAEVVGAKMDHYLGRDEEVAWRKVHDLRESVRKYSRTVMMP